MGLKTDQTAEKALRFLTTGNSEGLSMESLAAACDRLVRQRIESSSEQAIELGHQFVKRARGHNKFMLSTALRAYAWALLVGGRYRPAEESYLEARTLLRRDPLMRGRIDRALIDIYMYLGNPVEAKRRARLATAAFKNSAADLAKTRVNYANVLHRQDRHRQAHDLYSQAAEYFHAEKNGPAEAICRHNQANTLVQLFDFEQADRYYRSARKIFEDHEQHLRANSCLYGLAWMHLLEGKFQLALAELTECEESFVRAGQLRETVLCRLDRAEVYLSLNLFVEARNAAAAAEADARRLKIKYEAAKAAFFVAKASVAMGRTADCRAAVSRAEIGFKAERNRPFMGVVELLRAQIEGNGKKATERLTRARTHFSLVQLPLWEAICDLQLLRHLPDLTGPLKRLNKNRAVKTVPHLFASYQTVLGDRLAGKGQTENAIEHWGRAAEAIDAVRANLPPLDLRSAYSAGNSDPHRRLIRAEAGRDPLVAGCWSERLRTAGVWAVPDESFHDHPQRTRVQQSLAELAEQVAALSGRIGDPGGSRGGRDGRNGGGLQELQSNVRRSLAALERSSGMSSARLEVLGERIKSVSRKLTVVQFHISDNDLITFVHANGSSRTCFLSGGAKIVRELTARWRFMVERAPYLSRQITASDLADERTLLCHIGRELWHPLDIPTDPQRVLILPEGELTNLPWQAITDGPVPLIDQHEIVVSPSLQHYLQACKFKTRSKRISVFVGDTEGIPAAHEEYAVLQEADSSQIEVHKKCRRSDWPDKSKGWIWHFSGHGRYRADNPFYSSLSMVEGPIFAADFRLRRNKVALVTLAACRTAQTTALPGEESTGLVRSLLEMGARNVIASHWAVADNSSAEWMNGFYNSFLEGQSAGAAARRASITIRERYPSAYHWAAFAPFGAG